MTAGGANQTVHVGENGTASVLATGAGDTIVAFTGSNTSIVALGDGETVSISAQGAASVTSGGNNQVIDIQAGGSAKIVTDGSGDTLNIGSGNVGSSAPAGQSARSQASAAPPMFTSVIQGQRGSNNTYNATDAAGVNELVLGTADTVNASAGTSTIFGLLADRVVASDQGKVYFVGGAGASTILGGTANATVFASTGQVFDVGAAQANVFVGGTAASTINAGTGGGSFFGGTSGDEYNIGTGAQQVFVGLGGADTLNGVSGAVAPTIFAIGAEHMTFTAATKPVTVVSFASGGVIDASSTGGNNVFFAGFGVGGNQTLIGSTQGADVFVAGANSANTPSSITIDNWHSGDVFYLGGFTAGDNTTMDAAIANSLANGAKGDLSFTLSDNTKITFAGNHPTNFSGTSAF